MLNTSDIAVEHIPAIISGVVSTVSTGLMFGFVGMVFWWWKRRIEKDEARGPYIRKAEHDARCKDIETKKVGKVDEVLKAVNDLQADHKTASVAQQHGFEAVSDKFTRVHTRIDATNSAVLETQKLIVEALIVKGKVATNG